VTDELKKAAKDWREAQGLYGSDFYSDGKIFDIQDEAFASGYQFAMDEVQKQIGMGRTRYAEIMAENKALKFRIEKLREALKQYGPVGYAEKALEADDKLEHGE